MFLTLSWYILYIFYVLLYFRFPNNKHNSSNGYAVTFRHNWLTLLKSSLMLAYLIIKSQSSHNAILPSKQTQQAFQPVEWSQTANLEGVLTAVMDTQ